MTELDLRRSEWSEGIDVPAAFLHHQLYLLTCVVLASPQIDAAGSEAAMTLRQQLQEVVIGQTLLVIAAAIRNARDRNPARADYWLDGMNTTVGEFVEDTGSPTAKPLSFREACNKVLHTVCINFDYTKQPSRRGGALNPRVHLYGEKSDRDWKASLSLLKFVEVAFQLA